MDETSADEIRAIYLTLTTQKKIAFIVYLQNLLKSQDLSDPLPKNEQNQSPPCAAQG